MNRNLKFLEGREQRAAAPGQVQDEMGGQHPSGRSLLGGQGVAGCRLGSGSVEKGGGRGGRASGLVEPAE